jgi:hypothetical protein
VWRESGNVIGRQCVANVAQPLLACRAWQMMVPCAMCRILNTARLMITYMQRGPKGLVRV